MVLQKIISKTVLITGIISILFSCKGQIKTESRPTALIQKSIGNIVHELDSKAVLIYQDKKNNYWFASKDKGVYQYDEKTLRLFNTADGLISNRIITIQEDKNSNLYFDTPKGISKFDGQTFVTLEVIKNNIAQQEWKLEQDDLWFSMGWDKKGPYRFDGKNLYYLQFPKNEMEDEFYTQYPNASFSPYGIYRIYKDRKGHMWFGTASMGIYCYNGQKITWMYEQQLTETPEGGAFGIRSIAEDKDGYFWICNANYKYKILPDNSRNNGLNSINYKRETGIDHEGQMLYFLAMATDNNKDIWMVTYDHGVWQNNGKTLTPHPIKESGKNVLLHSIYMDNHGTLWVNTQDKGAYKYNGKTFEPFRIN